MRKIIKSKYPFRCFETGALYGIGNPMLYDTKTKACFGETSEAYKIELEYKNNLINQ